MNPQTLGLLVSAASTALKAVPKNYLARFGLARAPLAVPMAVSPLPAAAAVAGGALVVALLIPSSRRWLGGKAQAVMSAAHEFARQDSVDAASAQPVEAGLSEAAEPVAV